MDRSEAHMQMASKFLGGFCKHAPADIVEIWVKSPWGIPKKGRWERNAMFSMDHDFRLLKPVHPGITSFAVQIVKEQLEKDIQQSVKKSGGLQVTETYHLFEPLGWIYNNYNRILWKFLLEGRTH